MASAVRWKIKDLLDIPLAEAAVDYFLLPPDAYRGRQSMLYAAAIRQTVLQSLVEPVIAAGLAVDTVEVAELALHNLVARLPLDRGATAVLQLYDTEGFVNLVEGGEIYLCRRIDLGLSRFREGADNSAFFEALLLEIQRSMDFYESQLGKGIVSTLYLSPQSAVTSQIGGYLSTQLGLNIAPLDLADLDWQLPADMDGRCVTAIGAALQPLATKASASKPAAGAASAAH
jgi:MSHA biogenesis protein MshI